MDLESTERAESSLPGDPGKLVERILASPAVTRSARLSELLVYLAEWTLSRPGVPLTEQQIGVAVFGRQPGYDTTSDTIVRVQVSHLRKKLDHYFQTEGLGEPLVVEIPKRTYAPVFRPREQAVEAMVPLAPRRFARYAAAAAILLLAAACLWLAIDNYRLRRTAAGADTLSSRFLKQAFGDGRPLQIVVSDGAVMALNNYLDHIVTPQEYRSGFPGTLLDRYLKNQDHRPVLDRIAGMNLTTLQDAQVGSQIQQRVSALGIPVSLVFARDFRYQPQGPDHLVLIGHRKANPWEGLFEEKLNFVCEWDSTATKATVRNRAPQAGEAAEYPIRFGVETYAVVAFLAKPGGDGSVLLLEGGEMGATLAAAAMIARDDNLAALKARLGVKQDAPVPRFEALIRARLLGNVVHQSEIIAHRLK